jgi:hypothetical protein
VEENVMTEPEDREHTLPQSIDARDWADEWLKTIALHPDIPTDRMTMVTWFANAIMAGYDAAERR